MKQNETEVNEWAAKAENTVPVGDDALDEIISSLGANH